MSDNKGLKTYDEFKKFEPMLEELAYIRQKARKVLEIKRKEKCQVGKS